MLSKLENKISKPNRGKILALYNEIGANNLVSMTDMEKIAKNLKRTTGYDITPQDVRNLVCSNKGFMVQYNQDKFLRNDSSIESINVIPSDTKKRLSISTKSCSEEIKPIVQQYRSVAMSNYGLAQDIEEKRKELEEEILAKRRKFNYDIQLDQQQLDQGRKMENHLEEIIRLMQEREKN
jgi:hypothetical protein